MNDRKFLPEMLGLPFYKTAEGEYFYAWSAKHAIKKRPHTALYIITDYGEELRVRGT